MSSSSSSSNNAWKAMADAQTQMLMDYLKEACSICFENRCNFSLPTCHDQFCQACFGRFVTEVIHNAWGLSSCQIVCPVCAVPIAKETWAQYVTKEIVTKFDRINSPFRLLSRYCPKCGEDASGNRLIPQQSERSSTIDTICQSLREMFPSSTETMDRFSEEIGSRTPVVEVYRWLSDLLFTEELTIEMRLCGDDSESSPKRHKRNHLSHGQIVRVLELLVSLEASPERWQTLQIEHSRKCFRISCHACSEPLCIRCGQPSWHEGKSCEEYLREHASCVGEPMSATLLWQLENSKRCPNCYVLITREEGCNQVHCAQCGHKFCWVCSKEWSAGCGFFRCTSLPGSVSDDATSSPETSPTKKPDKPELGVPNVSQIENRVPFVMQRQAARRVGGHHHRAESSKKRTTYFVKDWLLYRDIAAAGL